MKLLDYSGLQGFFNKVKTLLDSKSNTGHTHTVSDVSGLSTVATSGDYGDLSNTPTIPTVNNAKLTIQKNGTTVKTFTANASSNVTANITVPTAVSELTNDSGYLTSASSLDSSKLTGTIDIARLPKGALERLVTVTDQTARFALTTSDVQLGDTVKQLDTGVMYIVTDESKLNSEDGYTEYTAGSATSVPWSGVTGKPSSYTPASHSHGNVTNDGTLGTASRALITDGNKKITTSSVTSTELGYVSGVTSAIQTQLNGKAASSHTHTASEVSGLSTVATTGNYTDLNNIPSNFTPASHTHGSITNDGKLGTASRALVTDSSKKIAVSSVTSTELGYLSGVTSAVQTQLNGKSNTGHTHVTSEVTDLLNSQHTWSAQQSYSADLNLNYTSTDVDDILDTVAGSYTAEDFLAQNNVWTGSNVYSSDSLPVLKLKNTSLDISSLPASNLGIQIGYLDKNNVVVGGWNYIKGPDGTTRLYCELATKNSNNQEIRRTLRLDTDQNGVNWQFYPSSADINLGTSTNQWKSVYAQNYFYNGTQWGLDQANTWSGNNTYTANVSLQGGLSLSSSSDVAEQFIQKLPKDVTVSTDALARFSTLQDSEGHYVVTNTEGHWATYVAKSTTLKYQNDSTKQGTVELRLNSNGKGLLYPVAPFECDLGNAQNQWNNLYVKNYFYNGTQWGLDKANEWTGSNKFKSSSTNFGLQSTVAEVGSLTASSNWIYWQDKNGYQDAYISRDFWNDGSDSLRISISGKRANGAPSTSGTAVECGVRLDIAANGTKSVNPFVSNDTDLGSSALRWRNLYTSDVSTDLVESFPGGTSLLIRSTDQTWENGARMFLYSNTHTGQTNGSIYIDVDHGDGNNTKTGLTLIPNLFIPVGGGTTGISLGSSTNRWSSVYADSYYYGTTRWGLDQTNTWTEANNFSILSLYSNSVTYNQAPSSNVELPSIRIFGGGKYCGAFDYVWSSTGENVIRLSLASYRSDGSFGYWACNFGVPRDFLNGGAFGTPAFYPNNNKGYNLGTSNNQWANTYTTNLTVSGTGTCTTPAVADNSTKIATTAWATVNRPILAWASRSAIVASGTKFKRASGISLFCGYFSDGAFNYTNDTPPGVVTTGTYELYGSVSPATSSTASDKIFGMWIRIA